MKIGPISPKAHGAWLGAGAGSAIAAEIINLIETYDTHKPLPASVTTLVLTVVPAVVAFLGSYLAPLLPSSTKKDLATLATEIVAQAQKLPVQEASTGSGSGGSGGHVVVVANAPVGGGGGSSAVSPGGAG